MEQAVGDTISSTEELRALVREEVASVLREFVRDPDFGLELRDETIAAIRESRQQIADGETVSLAEVRGKHLK